METETLSNYEQTQDKHNILDDSMDINISSNEQDVESHQTKEFTESNTTGIELGEGDSTDGYRELNNCETLNNKESVNDCVENATAKIDGDNGLGEEDKIDDDNESIESEDKSLCESIPLPLSDEDEPLSDDMLSDVEKNVSGREKATPTEEKDLSDQQIEADKIGEEVENSFSHEGIPSDEAEKATMNHNLDDSSNEEDKEESVGDNVESPEKDTIDEDSRSEKGEVSAEQSNDADSVNSKEGKDEENVINNESNKADEKDDLLNDDKVVESVDNKEDKEEQSSVTDESNKDDKDSSLDVVKVTESVGNKEDKEEEGSVADESNKHDKDSLLDEDKITEPVDKEDKEEKNPVADESKKDEEGGSLDDKNADSANDKEDKQKESPVTDENKKDEKDGPLDNKDATEVSKGENENNSEKSGEKKDITGDYPLLKETLTKSRVDGGGQQREVEGENGIEDIEMDDDFDPSLLCPDIAMEVDEAPVITNSDTVPNDGNKSPSLYEPVFSTYVDEMTGAEVSFNLTAEEQQMRQETFGAANPIQYTRIHCTACNIHLGSALDGQSNRFVHPLLKVLICKDCYHFYTSGEFEKDEDGSELYCRWCGQGGQVMCCAHCEMVFCKKCIRINYGRKKLTEIRDSDDWSCFRCNPSQLMALRIHCCEFIEYVRREISRAATLENAASFMSTDFSQCCIAQKKKYAEPPATSEPKRKRKKSTVDPDYDPTRDIPSPQPSTSFTEVQAPKPVPILPKPSDPAQNAGVVTQITQVTQPMPGPSSFKVGQTTFRPRSATGFAQPRPRVQVVTSLGNLPTTSSGPGYIKILPGGIRVTPPPSRAQTFVSSSAGRGQAFHTRPPRPPNHQMKHEWFEKTVRAAARVNSNLSYTLTQLNRAQATATSVEALAVVHNKLQEILSTSINSLIQIRKNLRTEFIAGIKNIRFPPKPPQPQLQTSTSSQDDDVIFISPTQSPIPPPMLPSASASSSTPVSSLNLPSSVSLTKRFLPPLSSTPTPSPIVSITKNDNQEKPKVFLRVKSLTALQNVPSECITIPDDPIPPPPPPPPLSLIQSSGEVTIIESSPEKQNPSSADKDVIAIIEDDPLKLHDEEEKTQSENPLVANGKDLVEKDKVVGTPKVKLLPAINLNEKHPHLMDKKLFDAKVKVYLTRSKEIDELAFKNFGGMNGNISN